MVRALFTKESLTLPFDAVKRKVVLGQLLSGHVGKGGMLS
jgi:hypothetical protein